MSGALFYALNSPKIVGRTPPRHTGEVTALPIPPSWIMGKGGERGNGRAGGGVEGKGEKGVREKDGKNRKWEGTGGGMGVSIPLRIKILDTALAPT